MGKENQLEQTTLMSFGKKLIHILLRDDNNMASGRALLIPWWLPGVNHIFFPIYYLLNGYHRTRLHGCKHSIYIAECSHFQSHNS